MTAPELKHAVVESALPWFKQLDPDTRVQVLAALQSIDLQSGTELFKQGEVSDALYVVITGSFGAFRVDQEGRTPQLIGRIAAGECAGEMGMLTGDPRGATVRALRDSTVLKLSKTLFEQTVAKNPQAIMQVARQAIGRAGRVAPDPRGMPRTFALLACDESVNLRNFAEQWVQAIGTHGGAVVLSCEHATQSATWFHQLESQHHFVLYVADGQNRDWHSRCVRQADVCLYLVHGDATPNPDHALLSGAGAPTDGAQHLIILHRDRAKPGTARRLFKTLPRMPVHHVREARDTARVARLLLGKSMNLVLSGGGARGFAHIGVIKALREIGFEIDSVCGTSIGAMVGAAVAAEWSIEEMTEVFRRAFVNTNPLNDYTLPLVSLVAGRKVSSLLQTSFGQRDIEDLIKPFFCVSANLTSGLAKVHDRGPLWLALRASVSIPGILPPVSMQGEVLVDGGVVDNLPVGLMRQRQQGEVIGVDIGGDHAVRALSDEYELPSGWLLLHEWFGDSKRPRLRDVLLRAGMLNASAMTQAARAQCSLLIRPELAGIGLLEWKAFDRAIAIGYHHTLRAVGGNKDALSVESPIIDV